MITIFLLGLGLGIAMQRGLNNYHLYKKYREGVRHGINDANLHAVKAIKDLKIAVSEAQLMETREAFKSTFYVDVVVDIKELEP